MPRLPFARTLAAVSVAALTAATLSACAEDVGPGRYERFDAGVPARVEEGTVVSSRPITLGGGNAGGATVVGGLVNAPVLAVPTSVGYGASFGGLAALLGMLNTCSPNVSVVNIDNGFGAACMATLINRM